MGDGVTQVNTDGGIDLGSTVVARSHQFLHFDKLLWKRHINRQLDAGSRHQSGHGLLRQILGPDPRVARPLIDGRLFTIVNRGKSQLVEHRRDVAFRCHITNRLTGPHS